MHLSELNRAAGRIGRLDCLCPPGARENSGAAGLWRMAIGFGLAILAQTLAVAALPLAAAIAPSPALTGLPYAAMLAGAALATFPAAFLLDSFGRRAAFALGASLGIAGGMLAGYAALMRLFPALCLGAFWLGLAHGFALFYRHAAAAGSAGPRGGALVLAGGVLAALTAPLLLQAIAGLSAPFSDSAVLFAAGLLDVGGLVVAVTLPHALESLPDPLQPPDSPAQTTGLFLSKNFWFLTALGALAWFVMTALMARAAPALAGCGASAAETGGIVAWHLVAMYAPAALLRFLPADIKPACLWAGGSFLLMAGAALFAAGGTVTLLAEALISAGMGWSLVNTGLLQALYTDNRPSRTALAIHDFSLLGAAFVAALVAGLV